jgi:hypothetical protein
MRLSAKILKNVNNVNSWVYANQVFFSADQANTVYIQLVDLDQSVDPSREASQAFPGYPIRYMPLGTVVTLDAFFDSLEDDEKLTIAGTQPFAQDKSIWKFDLTDEQIPSSGAISFTLTEDGTSKNFVVKNAVSVDPSNIGGC